MVCIVCCEKKHVLTGISCCGIKSIWYNMYVVSSEINRVEASLTSHSRPPVSRCQDIFDFYWIDCFTVLIF